MGPNIGTQEYCQLAVVLCGMLKRVYTNLGPQSRAGFNAKPVVVPKLLPITKITRSIFVGFSPYFNQVCKKFSGLAPKQYRKLYLEKVKL